MILAVEVDQEAVDRSLVTGADRSYADVSITDGRSCQRSLGRAEQPRRLACDHDLLAGANHEHGDPAASSADPFGVLAIGVVVERDAELAKSRADRLAQQRRSLAGAGAEDDRVDATQRRRHRRDRAADPTDEDVERELRAPVAGVRGALDLEHAGEPGRSRAGRSDG